MDGNQTAIGAGRDEAAHRRARRLRGARIARLLAPAAWRLGGFASSEVLVEAGSRRLRPTAAVATGEAPRDGVLTRAPLLVVELDPAVTAGTWLALGTGSVWLPCPGGARCLARDGTDVIVPAGALLEVPGCPGLTLPARELAPGAPGAPMRWRGQVG